MSDLKKEKPGKPARTRILRYGLNGACYDMAYVEWGDAAAPPVLCVHALTRNGRDFDVLGHALSDRFRVICPDLPGRGASEWLPDAALYQWTSYQHVLRQFLAEIGRQVMWLGTSLGGILGMAIAAGDGQPISRLVLNDLGPLMAARSRQHIRDYFSRLPDFASIDLLESYLRKLHVAFGELTDEQWAHMAHHSARMLENGRIGLNFDPAIAMNICAEPPGDVDLWDWWDRIDIPILALRGERSKLLHPDTASRMQASGARVHTVPNCGHPPSLMDAETIAVLRGFFEQNKNTLDFE